MVNWRIVQRNTETDKAQYIYTIFKTKKDAIRHASAINGLSEFTNVIAYVVREEIRDGKKFVKFI